MPSGLAASGTITQPVLGLSAAVIVYRWRLPARTRAGMPMTHRKYRILESHRHNAVTALMCGPARVTLTACAWASAAAITASIGAPATPVSRKRTVIRPADLGTVAPGLGAAYRPNP